MIPMALLKAFWAMINGDHQAQIFFIPPSNWWHIIIFLTSLKYMVHVSCMQECTFLFQEMGVQQKDVWQFLDFIMMNGMTETVPRSYVLFVNAISILDLSNL